MISVNHDPYERGGGDRPADRDGGRRQGRGNGDPGQDGDGDRSGDTGEGVDGQEGVHCALAYSSALQVPPDRESQRQAGDVADDGSADEHHNERADAARQEADDEPGNDGGDCRREPAQEQESLRRAGIFECGLGASLIGRLNAVQSW